jgi:hypothetical protein
MSEMTIDEQRFRELCEEAWKRDEAELDWKDRLCEEWSPHVPILFRIKNMLCDYFGFKDDVESVVLKDGESFEEAYRRRINEILVGRLNPPFDHNFWLNRYEQRAKDVYGRKESPPSETRGRRRR